MPSLYHKRLAPVKDPQIQQLDIVATGERNLPVGRGRIPLDLLGDFEAAWEGFRAAYPAYSLEQFVRYIVAKGVISASRAIHTRAIPTPKNWVAGGPRPPKPSKKVLTADRRSG